MAWLNLLANGARAKMRIFTRRRNRGQAIMEFAIILPILLLLSMLIVQYGILLHARMTLYHVSRNAGRFAAVRAMNPNSNAEITTYTVNMAANLRMTIAPSNISFRRYDPTNPQEVNPPLLPENTLTVTTNRPQYSWVKMRIIYNTAPKRFLPATFMGVTVFSENMTVDNVVMIE